MYFNSVFNIVDIVYSDDGSRALVIYNKDISGNAENDPAFFIKQYNDLKKSGLTNLKLTCFGSLLNQNTINIILYGNYKSSLWSPDGNMYVVNGGNGEVSYYCLEGNHSPNIHLFVSDLMKKEIYEQLGYNISDDSPGYMGVMLTALKWGEDSDGMLINYQVTDTADCKHSGHLWYNLNENKIYDFVENG